MAPNAARARWCRFAKGVALLAPFSIEKDPFFVADCLHLSLSFAGTGRGGDPAVPRGAGGLHPAEVREDQQPDEGLLAQSLQPGALRPAGHLPNER